MDFSGSYLSRRLCLYYLSYIKRLMLQNASRFVTYEGKAQGKKKKKKKEEEENKKS